MDSLVSEPTPAKKMCVINNENKMQLIECEKCEIRKFRLPQQFPSTLKQAVKQGIISPVESTPSILTMSKNVTTSLSGVASDHLIPVNKLQKLRILSPKGKDLGEFNLELRTDNLLKGKAITITKLGTFKPVKKPVTVTLPSISKNLILRTLKQGTVKVLQKNNLNIISCSKYETERNKTHVVQHCTTLPINKIIGNRDTKTRGEEAQVFINDDINVEIPVSTSKTNSKQSLYPIINSHNQKYIICNRISNTNSHVKIPKIKITEDSEATLAAKVLPHKKIIESPFSTINLKCAINSNSNNIHRSEEYSKVSKRIYIYILVQKI